MGAASVKLAKCVDARVGAARALRQRSFAGDAAERRLQLALDCRFARLHLPAVKIRAIVSDSQLPCVQRGCGLSLFGHDESLLTGYLMPRAVRTVAGGGIYSGFRTRGPLGRQLIW